MKYPGLNGGTPAARFSEQFDTVVSLFDQWNDCERTVVLCALLKRIPYSNLKFLQIQIDSNLAQAYNSQPKLQALESNANNAVALNKLINRYKNFSGATATTTMTKDHAQILQQQYDGSSAKEKYESREDILNDILTYLLLLRPGNEEAKAAYFNFIPIVVDDSIRQIVSTELVQHMFSYLLIHPAINNEDRRSLSHWLRHLQDHIASQGSGYGGCKPSHSIFVPNEKIPYTVSQSSPYQTSSTSSLSSSSWQTVAPPATNSQQASPPQSSDTLTSSTSTNGGGSTTPSNAWDLHKIQVTQDFCDDLDFTKSVGNTSSSGASGASNNHSSHASTKLDTSSDDHHVSFSKNGTEILDFNFDDFKSNTAIAGAYEQSSSDTFLTVPGWEHSAIKTRRSNSLTTSPSCSSQNACSSAENLASMANKPRSFSLSMESHRGQLTSAGSETRLDDLNKPHYPRYSTHNVGMSNIGQWLKSLRLHKYVWLFSNLAYDQMLDITEEYLENLGVTKGARHKLVLCINKLKERIPLLQQMEKDLTGGVRHTVQVLEDLTSIVMTPMKPVDMYAKDDVAGLFFRVLDIISTRAAANMIRTAQDEDTVNVILWILERSLHNEAFVAQTNQLKEHKYKLSKMKSQCGPMKQHYNKSNTTNANVSKPRWPNKHKSNSSDGLKPQHRRNSNTTMQSFSSLMNQGATAAAVVAAGVTQPVQPMYYHATTINNNNNYNKSSSYPNFVPSANSTILSNGAALTDAVQRSLQAIGQKQHQPIITPAAPTTAAANLSHDPLSSLVYRHSLNNLISLQQIQQQQQQQQQQSHAKSSISPLSMQCMDSLASVVTNSTISVGSLQQAQHMIGPGVGNCENSRKNDNGLHAADAGGANLNNSIGDINSRLEFLCLQMTDRLIN